VPLLSRDVSLRERGGAEGGKHTVGSSRGQQCSVGFAGKQPFTATGFIDASLSYFTAELLYLGLRCLTAESHLELYLVHTA
jgi:hypothetical protein